MEFTADAEVNSSQADNTKSCRRLAGHIKKPNLKYEYSIRGSRRRNCLGNQDGAKLKNGIAKVKPFLADFSDNSVGFVRERSDTIKCVLNLINTIYSSILYVRPDAAEIP